MPELAEVEFYRKRWALAATGERVTRVELNADKRPVRHIAIRDARRVLIGAKLVSSETAAKQMLFRFGADARLGVHLGMTGELIVAPSDFAPGRHDHLVLFTRQHALVFRDPRMFGRIEFHDGPEEPSWWTRIAPPVLSPAFTREAVGDFLRRRARSPIKAVLLMQHRFPGIGNWMADEILWRAAIHPARTAGALSPDEVATLWRACRTVARQALDAIAGRGNQLPADLNVGIPRSWLFLHRWSDGGRCPRTGALLRRDTIGGRTSCWSPGRQRLP